MVSNFGRYSYPALPGVRRASDRERLIFFAAAGLFAFLAFTVIFVLNFKGRSDASDTMPASIQPAAAVIGTVTLLAPDRYIKAGTKLSEISFREVYWPRDKVPPQAISDTSELRDFYASADIAEGTPLLRSHLTREAVGITLPLTPGNRAVSIEVDATAGVEGFALPGTKVDVVLTHPVDNNMVSQIIVQNARVLSYGGDPTPQDQLTSQRGRGVVRETERTITLDVSPQDALKIQTARQLGKLSLMLRAPDDNKSPAVVEQSQNDIVPNSKPADARKKACASAGSMRIEGKEYQIGCDGRLEELDPLNP